MGHQGENMDGGERWLDIPGFAGLYRASDRGRVFSFRTNRILTGTTTAGGYKQVRLTRPGQKGRTYLVHTLILTAFVSPRPPGMVANHKSGGKTENWLINLEWATPKANSQHASRMGLLRPNPLRGEKCFQAKLTDDKVRAIRVRRSKGEKYTHLAREFGVTPNAVRGAAIGLWWKHVA